MHSSVDPAQAEYRDRCHFFAAAATAMRHILVDRARRHAAQKRGGAGRQIALESGLLQIEASRFLQDRPSDRESQ